MSIVVAALTQHQAITAMRSNVRHNSMAKALVEHASACYSLATSLGYKAKPAAFEAALSVDNHQRSPLLELARLHFWNSPDWALENLRRGRLCSLADAGSYPPSAYTGRLAECALLEGLLLAQAEQPLTAVVKTREGVWRWYGPRDRYSLCNPFYSILAKTYAELVRQQPENDIFRYRLGHFLRTIGQDEEAASHFRWLASKFPDTGLARWQIARANLHAGLIEQSQHHYLTAARFYQSAIDLDPGLVQARLRLSLLCHEFLRDADCETGEDLPPPRFGTEQGDGREKLSFRGYDLDIRGLEDEPLVTLMLRWADMPDWAASVGTWYKVGDTFIQELQVINQVVDGGLENTTARAGLPDLYFLESPRECYRVSDLSVSQDETTTAAELLDGSRCFTPIQIWVRLQPGRVYVGNKQQAGPSGPVKSQVYRAQPHGTSGGQQG